MPTALCRAHCYCCGVVRTVSSISVTASCLAYKWRTWNTHQTQQRRKEPTDPIQNKNRKSVHSLFCQVEKKTRMRKQKEETNGSWSQLRHKWAWAGLKTLRSSTTQFLRAVPYSKYLHWQVEWRTPWLRNKRWCSSKKVQGKYNYLQVFIFEFVLFLAFAEEKRLKEVFFSLYSQNEQICAYCVFLNCL